MQKCRDNGSTGIAPPIERSADLRVMDFLPGRERAPVI
jgi:hypothetical protein